jgi:tricorn protease-like protein
MIMNTDGSDARAIPTPGLNVGAGKVLGNGDVILFADITRDPVRHLITWRWNSIGVDGSRRMPLPVAPPTGSLVGANVAPSHDGKRIAFLTIDTTNMSAPNKVHQSTLFTMSLDGTNVRRIATLQEDASGLSWSPDDRFIVAADNFTPHPVPADFVGDATIVRIDLASGAVVPLMHHDRRYLDEHPSWSTDGHIYFQSNRDGITDIYRMAADGSNQERITRPPK